MTSCSIASKNNGIRYLFAIKPRKQTIKDDNSRLKKWLPVVKTTYKQLTQSVKI
jgi:hypothetical protein